MSTFKFDTRLYDNGIIEHETIFDDDGLMQRTVRELVDTKDRHTREALIKLGWTPPGGTV